MGRDEEEGDEVEAGSEDETAVAEAAVPVVGGIEGEADICVARALGSVYRVVAQMAERERREEQMESG